MWKMEGLGMRLYINAHGCNHTRLLQRRLVRTSMEYAFNYHAPYTMYCFCRLSRLTWVGWACIAAYGKCALIKIGDQPPLRLLVNTLSWMPAICIHPVTCALGIITPCTCTSGNRFIIDTKIQSFILSRGKYSNCEIERG